MNDATCETNAGKASTGQRQSQRIVLLATSISYVLVILDTSIVNVALENIAEGLAADVAGLQWVVTAYIVAFASLVLSGGALGDSHGAQRVYRGGLLLFVGASLICGLAPSLPALVAGRVLQGVGAALLVPNALSLIRHAYPDDRARAKAIAAWAGAGGAAQVLGPLAGGLLLAAFDWRSIFFVNVPICLGGLWLTSRIGPGPDDQANDQVGDRGCRRLDLPGQFGAACAMVLLVAALIEGRALGWGSGWILSALALSALSALAFVAVQRRSASPMLPLSLFARPAFSWVCLAVLLGAAAFFGMLFALNLHFLVGGGYTPLQTGLAMMPLALSATAGNFAGSRLAHRVEPMLLMLAGAALRLAGFAGVAAAGLGFSYAPLGLPLLLIGLGAGLSNPMAISVMLAAADRRYAGVASGIATATGQLGAAIGVAIFGGFLADAPQIAEGTRMAATVSAVASGIIMLIVWRLRSIGPAARA